MYYTFSSLPFTFSHLGVKSGSDPTRPMSRLDAWQTGASGAISRDVAIEQADLFLHCCGFVNLVSLPLHSLHCSCDCKLLSELENDNFLLLLIIIYIIIIILLYFYLLFY